MKSYKQYEKIPLGASDVARLIIEGPRSVQFLPLAGDGGYSAYLVDGDAEIPDSYTEAARGAMWIKIRDDEDIVFRASAPFWRVLRRGGYGIILQLIDGPAADGLEQA